MFNSNGRDIKNKEWAADLYREIPYLHTRDFKVRKKLQEQQLPCISLLSKIERFSITWLQKWLQFSSRKTVETLLRIRELSRNIFALSPWCSVSSFCALLFKYFPGYKNKIWKFLFSFAVWLVFASTLDQLSRSPANLWETSSL